MALVLSTLSDWIIVFGIVGFSIILSILVALELPKASAQSAPGVFSKSPAAETTNEEKQV